MESFAPRQRTILRSLPLLTLNKSILFLWLGQILYMSSCLCSLTNAERLGSGNSRKTVGVEFSNNPSLGSVIYGRTNSSDEMNWDHRVDLEEDFCILWTIIEQDIIFEIQARTSGYVGFGFTANGTDLDCDMIIGWVDRGQTFFQDRYVKQTALLEPVIDPSQDYILIFGYENATHTVIRFHRKLDTCDREHDIAITNGTMRVVYMYNDDDPPNGCVLTGSLPQPNESWHSSRSLIIAQARVPRTEHVKYVDLRNIAVELPYGDDSLFWCKMFKLDRYQRKHHIVKYEPIFDSSWSMHYLQQITLYECQGNGFELEEILKDKGRSCMTGVLSLTLACNTIVTSWAKGSNGFTYPIEAGYPLESSHALYYLMETHYSNIRAAANQQHTRILLDNSGLRLYISERLRNYDAGILSIGIDPNWRHIIPPGQKQVVSVGQCIGECTMHAFPPQGIDIFAVMMKTHQIGKEVKLRLIRQTEELSPISHDNSIDAEYQDYRRLVHPIRSLPGDRLIVECIYDSSSRDAITLGGLSLKEERCTVIALYYPRQRKLTSCYSLPSLPTVLHSLGIEQLATNSNPVVISSPPELTGMTLEDRLLSYDWQNQFTRFQKATLEGTFQPHCRNGNNEILPVSKHVTSNSVNITKSYVAPMICKVKSLPTELISQLELPVIQDLQVNHITESGTERNSRSSIIETSALSDSVKITLHRSECLIIASTLTAIRMFNFYFSYND